MRFLIFLFVYLSYSSLIMAQTAAETFVAMPDSIIPYFDKDGRESLVNNKEVPSFLTNICHVDTITPQYIAISLTNNSDFSLVCDDTQGCVYILKTYSAPAKETVIDCYGKSWERIGHCVVDIPFESFVSDTLCQADSEDCLRFKEYAMYYVKYSLEENCFVVRPTFIAVNADDQKLLNDRIVSKKVDFCNIKIKK